MDRPYTPPSPQPYAPHAQPISLKHLLLLPELNLQFVQLLSNTKIALLRHQDDGNNPATLNGSERQYSDKPCFRIGRCRVRLFSRQQSVMTVVLVVFLTSSRQMLGLYFKIDHDHATLQHQNTVLLKLQSPTGP